MSEAKHTPGPWIAVGTWVEHPDDDKADICRCLPRDFEGGQRGYAESCANARLIAAAPDMYKALETARDVLEGGIESDHELELEHSRWTRGFLEEVDNILAKARGESE